MSLLLMGKVWELDLEPKEASVLLAYADEASDEDARTRPAEGRIAWKTNLSAAEVSRITVDLRNKGLLEVTEDGKGKPEAYRLTLEHGQRKPGYKEWLRNKRS